MFLRSKVAFVQIWLPLHCETPVVVSGRRITEARRVNFDQCDEPSCSRQHALPTLWLAKRSMKSKRAVRYALAEALQPHRHLAVTLLAARAYGQLNHAHHLHRAKERQDIHHAGQLRVGRSYLARGESQGSSLVEESARWRHGYGLRAGSEHEGYRSSL